MKYIFTLIFIFLLQINNVFAADIFVTGFEDLPLMEGLNADEEELFFDTPAGKIIESYAYTDKLNAKEVLDFYENTLPQLGWKKIDTNSYLREKENLIISSSLNNGILIIKFFLQPMK